MSCLLSPSRFLQVVVYAVLAFALTACGGGGGGSSSGAAGNGGALGESGQAPTVAAAAAEGLSDSAGGGFFGFEFGFGSAPVAQAALLITEVASNAGFADDSAWFEVYNPGTTSVNLAAFMLRSSSVDRSNNSTGSSTFALPAFDLPPKGYLVLAGKVFAQLPDGPKMLYLNNGTNIPSWAESGFIELIRRADNVTEDFVRFGTDTAAPMTPGAWGRRSVPALRTGIAEYGKSIVRLAARGVPDSNTSSDWNRVNFSTPGGPNDINPGVRDSDRDGVPDSAKVPGGTYAGLDLYAMGARPGKRDIFVELHTMANNPAAATPDAGLAPSKEALQKVVNAFAAKGIRFHVDVGTLYSATFNPALFNLGGGAVVPFAKCTNVPFVDQNNPVQPGCTNFYDYKGRGFDIRRRTIFHYGLFANSQNPSGSGGSSGIAEILGNDLLVTFGSGGLNNDSAIDTNLADNFLSSTLMHEFGHNLGLRHGGFENTNYKPNYVSIMNYTYQLPGLPGNLTTTAAADRYKFYVAGLNNETFDGCGALNSPCGKDHIIDYSNGSSFPLFEKFLIEQNLLGRGFQTTADYADWNLSGALDPLPYAFDLNRDGVLELLRDHDDWSAIVLPFTRSFIGYNSGATPGATPAAPARGFNPMQDMGKQMIQEAPPSPMMMRLIQNKAGR